MSKHKEKGELVKQDTDLGLCTKICQTDSFSGVM